MTTEEPTEAGLRERLVRDFSSSFIRIRGAHHRNPGEPCDWCMLAAEQAAEAVVTNESLRLAIEAGAVARERERIKAAVEAIDVADDWGIETAGVLDHVLEAIKGEPQ